MRLSVLLFVVSNHLSVCVWLFVCMWVRWLAVPVRDCGCSSGYPWPGHVISTRIVTLLDQRKSATERERENEPPTSHISNNPLFPSPSLCTLRLTVIRGCVVGA